LITGSPNLVRNAPENLLLAAKRLRNLRVCPCDCRPAPQKEVLGRSICYPSTKRCAWTNRHRGSEYLLFLAPHLFLGRRAGLHSQPEGHGAVPSRPRLNCSGFAGTFSAVCRAGAIAANEHHRGVVHTLETHAGAYNKAMGKQLMLFPHVHFKTGLSFSPALGRFTPKHRNG
jgi:hypothetical protein